MGRLLTVTPNPAIDVTYRVDSQLIGETIRVQAHTRRVGGKGINVARVLSALGWSADVIAPMDSAAADAARVELRTEKIELHATPLFNPTRHTVTVVDGLNHPTLFSEPGPVYDPSAWGALCHQIRTLAGDDDWVAVAGSFPPETPPNAVRDLVGAARSRGAKVLVDTSGAHLIAAVGARADVVKANAGEVREATGMENLHDAAARLGANDAVVVISLGSDGAILRESDGSWRRQSAYLGVAGNPTGAGDAFTAGLLAAFTSKRSLSTALTWGALAGAAAVAHPLAGAIDPRMLIHLAAQAEADARGLINPSNDNLELL